MRQRAVFVVLKTDQLIPCVVLVSAKVGHGFDDQGRRFDGQGMMRQWWTNSSIAAFVKRTQCFVSEYSNVRIDESGQAHWTEPEPTTDAAATPSSPPTVPPSSEQPGSIPKPDSGSKTQPPKSDGWMRINGMLTLGNRLVVARLFPCVKLCSSLTCFGFALSGENLADHGGLRASYRAFTE